MNNSLSEDAKRKLYQLNVERKSYATNASAGAFAMIAGTLIAIGNFFKAQGNRLSIIQEVNTVKNKLSDKEIDEQIDSLKKQLAELQNELNWVVELLVKTDVNIKAEKNKKYNLSEIMLKKSLEPDELVLLGSQIVVLGGISQAMAGTLLAIANTISVNASRLSMQNKIRNSKKIKNEPYLSMERQLKNFMVQIENLQSQISFIEKVVNCI